MCICGEDFKNGLCVLIKINQSKGNLQMVTIKSNVYGYLMLFD